MVEQFTLRWNKFHSNVSAGFVALLEDEELVDVTLAAEGQLLRAHKLVLSICSPYFKRLFKAHPSDHPVVILKDVTLSELRDILQFMYKGEVNICQQDLSSFLHTAELLQVRGLTENPPDLPYEDSDCPQYEDEKKANEEPSSENSPLPEKDTSTKENVSTLKRILNNSSRHPKQNAKKRRIKTEDAPVDSSQTANAESCDSQSDSDAVINFEGEMFQNVLDLMESSKEGDDIKQKRVKNRRIGNYKCILCHRLFTSRYNLKIHMRDKHCSVEDTLHCPICQKRMRNPSCLRVHLYHHRKQAANLPPETSPDITDQPPTETKNLLTTDAVN